MFIYLRSLLTFVLLASLHLVSVAQRAPEAPAPGMIGGRITTDGKPLPGIRVILVPGERQFRETIAARATTDEDGRYTLTNIAPGRYTVGVFAPTHVAPREITYAGNGKAVTLDAGENLDNIDFSLVRGGVITGRVTDADNQPVIEEPLRLSQVDEQGKKVEGFFFNSFEFMTDDRGIYRIFGLAPGRYLVSAGSGGEGGMVRIGFGGGFYQRTFHPEARTQEEATIIEVTPGSERSNIDIKLGHQSRTFVATGRIVDAESGDPLANLPYGYGTMRKEGGGIGSAGFSGARSTSRGEFRVEGLLPDRYAVFIGGAEDIGDRYSDPAIFEVRDADVSDLEIKVHRGASISGAVVIEGAVSPAVRARLSQLEFYASPLQRSDADIRFFSGIKVKPDGTFRQTGLRPNKYRFSLSGYPTPPKGFSLLRVEQNGSEVPNGMIEVGAGENASGVRLVLVYGTSTLRGQVQVVNGELPEGVGMRIELSRVENQVQQQSTRFGQVDSNRRFLFEGLTVGEYEVALFVHPIGAPGTASNVFRAGPIRQRVTLGDEGETQITLRLDLNDKAEGGGR